MGQFFDEVIAFGVSLEECYDAMKRYSSELWSEVDEAMGPLWESEDEREEAKTLFCPNSLVVGRPKNFDGAVVLEVDSDAEVTAESISKTLRCPTIAIRVHTQNWCKLVAFDRGDWLGWIFWLSPSAFVTEGEVIPSVVTAARVNGGWIGDPEIFEAFLMDNSSTSLVDILDAHWDGPSEVVSAVKTAFGVGDKARISLPR